MRVESKIQEKKIKLIKKGEFVEDKGYTTFPIYSFGNSDEEYSYEDSIKRKAEIIASYYFDRNTSDIKDIYVSLYNTQLSEENAKIILKEKSNEIPKESEEGSKANEDGPKDPRIRNKK